MPKGYGIGIDLHQLPPAAFADGEGELDGTPDEPPPLAGGTAPGNSFTGREQYLADPLHAGTATVFLATATRNALVQAAEKPIERNRSNGKNRADHEMCIHTETPLYWRAERSPADNECYRVIFMILSRLNSNWLAAFVNGDVHNVSLGHARCLMRCQGAGRLHRDANGDRCAADLY